jgi:hypothetical protein
MPPVTGGTAIGLSATGGWGTLPVMSKHSHVQKNVSRVANITWKELDRIIRSTVVKAPPRRDRKSEPSISRPRLPNHRYRFGWNCRGHRCRVPHVRDIAQPSIGCEPVALVPSISSVRRSRARMPISRGSQSGCGREIGPPVQKSSNRPLNVELPRSSAVAASPAGQDPRRGQQPPPRPAQ